MACTKEELTVGGRTRRPPPEARVMVSDTLLLATMYMIGMPVDVQAKDGSVYSGIFHTACVDDNYAIVLRKAILLKKGELVSNVLGDTLVETLVIGSEDLVQVVVKGDVFSSAEITKFSTMDGLKHAEGCKESLDMGSDVAEPTKPIQENDVTCCSMAEGTNIIKIDSTQNLSVDERQEVNCIHAVEDRKNDPVLEDRVLIDEVQVPNCIGNGFDSQSVAVQNIIDNSVDQEPEVVSSGVSKAVEYQNNKSSNTDDGAVVDSNITDLVVSIPSLPPKVSSTKKNPKSSNLNPEAKIFSPSAVYHRTNPTNFAYVPSATYTVATLANVQDEVDASSFAPPSVPIKYFPYNTLNDATYVQPILGQITNRGQPVRYIGQYQSVQSGIPYIHSNPQNIAFGDGRMGPVVFMHPVSSDAVQSAAGFTPATAISPIPMINPHQVHISKHQRMTSPQAVQVSMPPAQLQYPMPPPFPLSYPLTVPGQMGS